MMTALITFCGILSHAKSKAIWVYAEIKSDKELMKVVGKVIPSNFKAVLTGSKKKGFLTMKEVYEINDDGLNKVENELAGNVGSFPIKNVSRIMKIKDDPREYPLNDLLRLSEKEHLVVKKNRKADKHFYIDLKNKLFAGFGKNSTASDVRKEFKALSRLNNSPESVYAYVYAADDNSHIFRFDKSHKLLSVVLAGEKGKMSNGVMLGMSPDDVVVIMGKPVLDTPSFIGDERCQKYIYFKNDVTITFRFLDTKTDKKLSQIEVMF